MPEAPDDLKWNLSLRLALHGDNVPDQVRGRPVLSQSVLWTGDPEQGRRYLDHALSFGRPVGVTRRVLSFLALQTMADDEFPHGRRYYTKSGYFKSLDDCSIGQMVSAIESIPSPFTQVELAYLGGAAARVGPEETAFGDRSSPFVVNILANWSDDSEDSANVAWVRNLFGALRPAMTPGVYVNFMSGDEDDRVPEAYHQRWERLLGVKLHYDPENLFRRNQNIRPRNGSRSPQSRGLRNPPDCTAARETRVLSNGCLVIDGIRPKDKAIPARRYVSRGVPCRPDPFESRVGNWDASGPKSGGSATSCSGRRRSTQRKPGPLISQKE